MHGTAYHCTEPGTEPVDWCRYATNIGVSLNAEPFYFLYSDFMFEVSMNCSRFYTFEFSI